MVKTFSLSRGLTINCAVCCHPVCECVRQRMREGRETDECVVTRPCLYVCETEMEGESVKKTKREEEKIYVEGNQKDSKQPGKRRPGKRRPSTEAYGSDGDNTQQWASILWPEACRPASSGLPVKGAIGLYVLFMWMLHSVSGKTKQWDYSKSLAKRTIVDTAT